MRSWEQVLVDVKAHAESDPKHEVCGIILEDGTVVRCQNVAEETETRYRIASSEVVRYAHQGIRGFYHSHVNRPATPSFRDHVEATMPGKRYIVVRVQDGKATEVRGDICRLDLRVGRFTLVREEPWLAAVGACA